MNKALPKQYITKALDHIVYDHKGRNCMITYCILDNVHCAPGTKRKLLLLASTIADSGVAADSSALLATP
jgi:hypothetical protein